MKTVPLTRGFVALVDDDDYERVSKSKWCWSHGYALRHEGGRKNCHTVFMHRRVLRLPNSTKDGLFVDHINLDKLDNGKANLRTATKGQNSMNRALQRNNTSGFRGVRWMQGKWQAFIKAGGKQRSLGCFASRELAAVAFNKEATRLFKEYARLNSLPSGLPGCPQEETI